MAIGPFQQAFRQAFDVDFGFGPPPNQRQYLTPEEEESLLAQLGGVATGGLGLAANILDTPGAFVRGLIAGENPFPGIFDVSQRTSVEDLTGSDNFFTNLGAGIALDPLTYLTFGGSAVAKHGAGGVARAAGLLDDASRVAGTGKRVARMRTTLDDLIAGAADPVAAEEAAQMAAQGVGANLANIRGDKLGGLVGVGLPFMDPFTTFGSGAGAQKFAGGLDRLGESVAYSRPGRFVASLFDPRVKGETVEATQRALRERAPELEAARRGVMGDTLRHVQLLKATDQLDPRTGEEMVQILEGWASRNPNVPNDALDDVLGGMRQGLDEIPDVNYDLGLPSARHYDPAYERAMRPVESWAPSVGTAGGPLRVYHGTPHVFDQFDPSKISPNDRAFYFSDDITTAATYGDARPYNIHAKNPLVVTPDDFPAPDMGMDEFFRSLGEEGPRAVQGPDQLRWNEIIEQAKASGHDAVIFQNAIDPGGRVPRTGPVSPANVVAVWDTPIIHPADLQPRPIQGPIQTPYFPHVLTDTRATGQIGRSVFPTKDPFGIQRDITGIAGGRETINQISRDPDVYLAATPDLAKQVIEGKYGTSFIGDNPQLQMEQLAKSIRGLQPDQSAAGMFGNHPLVDQQARRMTAVETQNAANAIYDVVAKEMRSPSTLAIGDNSPTLEQVFRQADLNPGDLTHGAMKQIAQRLGGQAPQDLLQWRIDPEIGESLARIMKGFTQPESISTLGKAVDSFTAAFKAGVLTWPAYHVRNRTSGMVQNWIIGEWSPWLDQSARAMLKGATIDDALQYPIVTKILSDEGLPHTAEAATDVLRRLVGQYGVVGKHATQQGAVTGAATMASAGVDELLGALPGARPLGGYAQQLKGAIPTSRAEANPLNLRGVGGRKETTFAPVKASADISYTVEGMNRITPFLSQLRRGVDPQVAAAKVLAAHANYSPRAFTQFENAYMRRLAPFYSFSRAMVPFVLKNLMEHPGGRMAQTIRATDQLSGSEDWLPEWIANTAAIPLGEEGEGGNQRFLTGLGLMHEDVLGLLRPGVDAYHTVQNLGQELLGRSNPLVKGPVELMAGRQFYTGRELEDLDSSIGRTIQNVAGTEYPPEVPILLDQVLSNSPLARVASTARTLTDPRKEIWAKAMNLGTGARLTDVDMDLQRSVQSRELLEDILRSDPAVKSFEHIYVSPEDEARLSPEELQAMNLYRTLSRQAQQAARQRKNQQPSSVYDLLSP